MVLNSFFADWNTKNGHGRRLTNQSDCLAHFLVWGSVINQVTRAFTETIRGEIPPQTMQRISWSLKPTPGDVKLRRRWQFPVFESDPLTEFHPVARAPRVRCKIFSLWSVGWLQPLEGINTNPTIGLVEFHMFGFQVPLFFFAFSSLLAT